MFKLKSFILCLVFLLLVTPLFSCMEDMDKNDDVTTQQPDDNDTPTTGLSPEEFEAILNALKQYEKEVYTFGSYEQDGDLGNGPETIEWFILEENIDSMLLISKYILSYEAFNESVIAESSSWKRSTLRNWLNNTFYNSAFNDSEKKRIISTEVQDYKADNAFGEKTIDNVFILNKKEAFSYFKRDIDRAAEATAYADSLVWIPSGAYWLIDSYTSDLYKYAINSEGANSNNPRVNESEGVRPVIWVKK